MEVESYLLLGPSNTGKTTFIKQKLAQINKPVWIVHGGADAKSEYQEFTPQFADLEDCKKLKRASVVVEDFVKEKNKQGTSLLKLLGYLKRHQGNHIFLATYQVSSTGASGLLSCFDKVVFTRHPSNWRSVQIFCRLYPMEALTPSLTKSFLSSSRHRYLVADLKAQTVETLGDEGSVSDCRHLPEVHTFSQNRTHFERMLSNFDETQMLCAILEFLERNVDLDKIVNGKDFSIELSRKSSESSVKASLLDFLIALREEKKRPSPEVRALFKFFSRSCHFPNSFVNNTYLLRDNK
jgi:hypothetical protein